MATLFRGGTDWTFDDLQAFDRAIAEVAHGEFGLDTYANQIEVISTEQMLDAYASGGMPVSYPHWSKGKEFIRNEQAYRRGARGLAYELVINSNPCIAYLMEENSAPLQALVIAHACYGHNAFFKGNYLFRKWTDADAIVDAMVEARRHVMACEQKYGIDAVEDVLDACHALMDYTVERNGPRAPASRQRTMHDAERAQARARSEWERWDPLWRTVPQLAAGPRSDKKRVAEAAAPTQTTFPSEPVENLLGFVEEHAPRMDDWKRELVRIVREMGQYFYPQTQTKLMNEGYATFWHYTILNRLYDKGMADDAFMLEFLHVHTNVVTQRGYDQPGYGGMNPYALGLAIFQDIRRICERPTAEDREWFPQLAGSDWVGAVDFAMRNYKDESFVMQYLSPKVMRELRLFAVADHRANDFLEIEAIHDDSGYRRLRKRLAAQYDRDATMPNIQVMSFDRDGDRSLVVRYTMNRMRPLNDDYKRVAQYLADLWGFRVRFEFEADERSRFYEHFDPSH